MPKIKLMTNNGLSKKKRIAIDARFFAEAGPGRYAKNIIEYLEKIDTTNEYIIFLRPRGYEEYIPKNPNFKKVLTTVKWYSWKEQLIFLWQVASKLPDVFYVPHFNIPVLYPFKLVTAIPDIIMHTYSTEKGTTLPKFYFRFKKFVYRLVLWWAIYRSIKVIVPTNDVLNDMLIVYPKFSRDKFVVAPEGVDPVYITTDVNFEDLSKELGVTKPYLLYVSSMYEHKNVHRLIDAFKILISEYKFDGQFVMVGKNDKFSQEVASYIKTQGLDSKIILPGMQRYISDPEIVSLRKNALLYVFPSLKEGFSLTPLEAQAVGLPCVISDIPCHKEVFEDSVIFFDPHSIEDIAAKINLVLQDIALKTKLVEKGYAQVKKYDWAKTATTTLEILKNS